MPLHSIEPPEVAPKSQCGTAALPFTNLTSSRYTVGTARPEEIEWKR
jgi:hypothetical protein